MSDKKASYKKDSALFKQKYEIAQNNYEKVKERLELIENFRGLDTLEDNELETMEKLYYKGLDMVKNIKFQKKYIQEIESLRLLVKKNDNAKEKRDQENIKTGKSDLSEFNLNLRQNVLHQSN